MQGLLGMTKPLLPQAFWFRFAFQAPRVEGIPRLGASPGLLDLPASCALPDLRELEGQASWAQVRVGWNPKGLGVMVLAEGVSEQQLALDRPEGFANVQFWVDTRDARDVARATRFCHRFAAHITLSGSEKRRLEVVAEQRAVARALADAPLCRRESISASATLRRSGWVLEVFLPASTLNGFDPELNRRFGFAYQVSDQIREDQFLGVGRDLPIGENPSLWSTLVLCDS